MEFHDFNDDMFASSQKINFHGFKNGQHKFRLLPPYAPGKMYEQVGLHWGYTDENGKVKALKCTLYSHKNCPICAEVERLKGEIELIELGKGTIAYTTLAEAKAAKEVIEKRISDIRRKPTYLWNILTENGEQKVLTLSWNGHDPLFNKVKLYWEQKKINVTNPNENYLIFCERSGQAAKTRYNYEVLDGTTRKLEDVKNLVDLSKVYKDYTPSELQKIVDEGQASLPTEDPNDRNFVADMPSGMDQQTNTVQTPQKDQATQTTSAPVEKPAPTTTQTTTAQTTVKPTSTVTQTVEDELAAMQNLLND